MTRRDNNMHVQLFYEEHDYLEIDDVLFPGKRIRIEPENLASDYAQQFVASSNSVFTILSLRISLKYKCPVQPCAADFLVEGLDLYLSEKGADNLDGCLNIEGRGSATAIKLILKSKRDHVFRVNLFVLQYMLGLSLSISRKLVYARDVESLEGEILKYGSFVNLSNSLLTTKFKWPLVDKYWHWNLLPNDAAEIEYLNTFLLCSQLDTDSRKAVKDLIHEISLRDNETLTFAHLHSVKGILYKLIRASSRV